jgi:hypothetical protein
MSSLPSWSKTAPIPTSVESNVNLFKPAEIVIVLLLIHCHPLQAKYCWPYVIESRLNDLNYIVNTPMRRKKRQIYQVTTQDFSKG